MATKQEKLEIRGMVDEWASAMGAADGPELKSLWDRDYQDVVYIAEEQEHAILGTACIYLASGAGEIVLTSSDPQVQPALDYNFLAENFDRERLREGIRIIIDLIDRPGLKELIAERIGPTDADLATDEALDRWMMGVVSTSHHVSTTCKMGPGSDPMAVVDQHGKVHGIEGLRVADASIMPDCVRANTNVTSMVIGERVSDFIRCGL